MPLLDIRNLTARYGQITALRDASITVNAGEAVALLGANGAGKSTLMKTLMGFVSPSEGSIEFHGAPVSALRGQALRDWQRDCAMIFQQFNLVGRLDVLTNVLMGRLNHVPSYRSLLRLWTTVNCEV